VFHHSVIAFFSIAAGNLASSTRDVTMPRKARCSEFSRR
jgi:hypothetical protein